MNASAIRSQSLSNPRIGRDTLSYFIWAFGFLCTGLAALVWNSERLSQGGYSDPLVLAGVHSLTLGWLSLSIFGALRVFTGVALGSQGSFIKLGPWIRHFWACGAVLFIAGLASSGIPRLATFSPWLVIPGVLSLGCALCLQSAHLLPALFHAKRGSMTRFYLIIALASLWGTWLLGGSAAFARVGHPVVGLPSRYLEAHILLAVFGWVGATVVGVGSHLIPMFALSRETPSWPVSWALPVWTCIPVLALSGAYGPSWLLSSAWGMAFLGSVLWIIQVALYFRTRIRRERDAGLFLAGGSTMLLGLAWVIALLANAPIAFIGSLVVGWLSLFTLGIYHRVVPFLVWYIRFTGRSSQGGSGGVRVKDLIDSRLASATAVCGLIGAAMWGVGLLLTLKLFVYAGSSLILIGAVIALGQIPFLSGAMTSRVSPLGVSPKAQVLMEEHSK